MYKAEEGIAEPQSYIFSVSVYTRHDVAISVRLSVCLSARMNVSTVIKRRVGASQLSDNMPNDCHYTIFMIFKEISENLALID